MIGILISCDRNSAQTTPQTHHPALPVRPHYWPEIDGLRAIAVLLVIFYHLDAHLILGGFVGVDVFFVISGYVVSRSLAHSDQSSFSGFIIDFYARRIARIVPALILCLIVTSTFMILLTPNSWLSGANQKTARLAVFGMSNFALIEADTYFSPRPEYNPFTHTWSLAVEEQFYLIFPFIFYIWVKFYDGKNYISFVLRSLLFLFSIYSLLFLYFIQIINPAIAFFMLPPRFWELATGALLFQLQTSHSEKILSFDKKVNLFSFLGIILIFTSAYLADRNAFPFPWSIPSVIGTFFLLSTLCQTETSFNYVGFFLRQPPFVFIGKISYSLYLWHWGVYCLFRWTVGLETIFQMASAVLLSLILSIFSYFYIEKPMRAPIAQKNFNKSHYIIRAIMYIIACYILIVVGFQSQDTLSFSTVAQNANVWYPEDHLSSDAETGCAIKQTHENSGILKYEILSRTCADHSDNGPAHRLYVIGDSHADAYHPLLAYLAGHRDVTIVIYSNAGCAYANFLRPNNPHCAALNQAVTDDVLTQAKAGDLIFLSSLRMNRLGDQWARFPEESVRMANIGPDAERSREIAYDEASALLKQFSQKSIHIIIEAPKPLFASPAFRCSDWFNATNPICRGGLARARDEIETDRAPIMASLEKLSAHLQTVIVWDPLPILCPDATCYATTVNGPLFFDGDHLSHLGNERLIPSFLALIDTLRAE